MSSRIGIGLAAGFGGMAPNVFRVATELTLGKGVPEASYLLGVLLFFGMGAATALALGETEAKKALFLGLGLPAMFQSAAQDVSTASATLEFSRPAYAMVVEEPERRIEMKISWASVVPGDFSLIYRGEKRKRRVKDDFGPEVLLEDYAPIWASGVQAVFGDVRTGARSEWLDFLPGASTIRMNLLVENAPLTGLRKAIGIRDVKEFKLTLELAAEEMVRGKR